MPLIDAPGITMCAVPISALRGRSSRAELAQPARLAKWDPGAQNHALLVGLGSTLWPAKACVAGVAALSARVSASAVSRGSIAGQISWISLLVPVVEQANTQGLLLPAARVSEQLVL